MMHLLIHLLGIDDVSGHAYAFWSGFGSDLGELAIVGGLLAMIRKHNCHVHRCWRIARHPVAGTEHIVCRKHHPKGAPTHHQVLAEHAENTS